MTDDELRECILQARRIAEPIGPMHGLWDVISDAEAILKGEPSILPRTDIEDEFIQCKLHTPRQS